MIVSSELKLVVAALFFGTLCFWSGPMFVSTGSVQAATSDEDYDPTADYPEDTTPDEDDSSTPGETGNPDAPDSPDSSTPPTPAYKAPPSTITPGELYVREKPFTQGCAGRSFQNWGSAEMRKRNQRLRARNASDIDCANDTR